MAIIVADIRHSRVQY